MFLKLFWTAARRVRLGDIVAGIEVAKELFKHIKELIGHLRPETKKAIEVLQQASTELSERLEELAAAAQTLSARATVALLLAATSFALALAGWIFLLFRPG
jgi:uncharacterized protein YbjQ (UPF0145 family)